MYYLQFMHLAAHDHLKGVERSTYVHITNSFFQRILECVCL